jgi:hypothetical protein
LKTYLLFILLIEKTYIALPFKAGVNISGNLDKMKIRVGKAKYKDDVTPAAIHKVDSTRMDLGRRIVERFHRIVGVR